MFRIQERGSSVRAEVIGGITTLSGVRTWLAKAVSRSMKHSFAAGIGLFLTFIGLFEAGIVKSAQAVPVQLGDIRSVPVLLAIAGFVIIASLMYRKVPGAIL